MTYFNSKKVNDILLKLRGRTIIITFDKVDGTERVMEGILGLSKDGVWLVNEQLDDALPKEYKRLSLLKIKVVSVNGTEIRPLSPNKKLDQALKVPEFAQVE